MYPTPQTGPAATIATRMGVFTLSRVVCFADVQTRYPIFNEEEACPPSTPLPHAPCGRHDDRVDRNLYNLERHQHGRWRNLRVSMGCRTGIGERHSPCRR